MGPDLNSGVLFTEDGTPLGPISDIQITPGTPSPDGCITRCPGLQKLSFSMIVSFPKVLRCHSRKRLVKLIMSERMSRSFAEAWAEIARDERQSYQIAWFAFLKYLWKYTDREHYGEGMRKWATLRLIFQGLGQPPSGKSSIRLWI